MTLERASGDDPIEGTSSRISEIQNTTNIEPDVDLSKIELITEFELFEGVSEFEPLEDISTDLDVKTGKK